MVNGLLAKCLIVIAAFAVGISAYLLTSSKWADFWKKDPAAHVYFNGSISPGSALYRRNDGLSLLNTAEDGAWYIYSADGAIEYCDSFDYSTPTFCTVRFAGYFYVWHYAEYPCIGGVTDLNPELVKEANMIEFNSVRNDRIRVTW